MPEKERAPHKQGKEMGGISQSQGHLHDKSAEELLTEFEAKLDTITGQSYDADVVDSYLGALDKQAPLQEQFDVKESWKKFRFQHAILFEKDGSLHWNAAKPTSHRTRFCKFLPRFVAVAAMIGVLSMFCAQAAGIDVLGAIGRWTEETFRFAIPSASHQSSGTEGDGEVLSRVEQYLTLRDALDAYSISEPFHPGFRRGIRWTMQKPAP